MSTEAIWLRLYALICAIEADLRALVEEVVLPEKTIEEIFSSDLLAKLVDRRKADADAGSPEIGLVHFTNIGDVIDVIYKLAHNRGSDLKKNIKTVHSKISALIPIRNRVMHLRPLLFEDLPTTVQTRKLLVQAKPAFWSNLKNTIHNLNSDPTFLLRIEFRSDLVESKKPSIIFSCQTLMIPASLAETCRLQR